MTDGMATRSQPRVQNIGTLLRELERWIEGVRHNPETVRGLSTGFKKLDQIIGGIRAGDLILVAGSPGVGKTSFVMNMFEHFAIEESRPVAMFSMGMTGGNIIERLVASFARIEAHKLHSGLLEESDYDRFVSAQRLIAEAPLYIDATQELTHVQISERSRILMARHQIKLLVIDYFGLIRCDGAFRTRREEILEIARGLKALAKELAVPVIVPFQISQDTEFQDDWSRSRDLQNLCGADQYADTILFLDRPVLEPNGLAQIIVAKHPRGKTGSVTLPFLQAFNCFDRH